MRKRTFLILFTFLSLLLWAGAVSAQGTPLTLGPGQDLRINLPLEPGKAYEISMEMRTALEGAAVTMTLQLRGENGQVLDSRIAQSTLDPGGAWTVLGFIHVPIPHTAGRWELVVTADRQGLYYWQNLKVLRSYQDSRETIAYQAEQPQGERDFYTGLVVDARHLDVRRGISPRIYSEGGQLIYGGVLAPPDLVQERGVVAYGSELTPELLQRLQVAPDDPYVNPLVVKAIGVADAAKTGVYISAEDTQRILQAMAQYDFFARYAVIFLVE
ncbi:MAG TPA: hypothetical protein PLM25_01345 [Limnochordia bacterium]|nr:hypothetical protein [Limnochordia bacterium]